MALEIFNKVMLAGLNISVFSGERVDKSVSKDIASQHGTTPAKAGSYKKQIISKTSLEAIQKVATDARQFHYARTLPWSNRGDRLLSTAGFLKYAEGMARFQSQFDKEVDFFVGIYDRLIEEARSHLNGMFNVNDYPDIRGLRGRFCLNLAITPVADPKNWFTNLAEEELEMVRASAENNFDNRLGDAVKNAFEQVADVTKKMADKLTEYETDPETGKVVGTVFRDSLVENVRELAEILPTLNVTDDPVLSDLADRMSKELCKFDASALRADPEFRKKTASSAMSLYEEASKYL